MAAREAELIYRKLVDGGMIYDSQQQQIHHLNATAALVWEACQQGRSAEEIAAELCRQYEVSAEQARADVEKTLETFAAAGLIHR